MNKTFALIIVVVFFSATGFSQDYRSSIGFRMGASNGISYKHFLNDEDAVDAILSFRYKSLGVAGLWERHAQFLDVWGLKWYYGGGAHFINYVENNNDNFGNKDGGLVIGVDGVFGAEYTIREIPITVSLDIRPGINLIGVQSFVPNEIGLSIRYVLSNRAG